MLVSPQRDLAQNAELSHAAAESHCRIENNSKMIFKDADRGVVKCSLSPLPPPTPMLPGDWSVVRSVVLSQETAGGKLSAAAPKRDNFHVVLWFFYFLFFNNENTYTHTHTPVVWLFFFSRTSWCISYFTKSQDILSPPPLAAQILFICSLTRGVFSFTFFAAVGDVILHMFSILHLQVRDLGRTTGALWLSVLLSPDYFAFLFFFIFFAPIGKKIRFIFSFDLQDHGRKYVFEK